MSSIFNPQTKILFHLDKVQEYFDNKNPDPITIEIDPSNACNHSCPFCISGHLHLKKYKDTDLFNRTMLDKNTFKKLVEDLVEMRIDAINWTGGGEPTMNPYLGEAINYIGKNSNIKMGMFSNGSMLERFNLYKTITENLDWIRISIDAGKKDSYDQLRVTNKNNNFEVVINNIKKLIKIKKETNSNLTIGVGFVVTEDNYEEIDSFSKIFKKIDVDYCQFKPEIIQIERSGERDKFKEQISCDFWLSKVIDLLDEAKNSLGKKFECNSYKIEDLIVDVKNYGRNYKMCIGSQFQPCIGADGNVYVCTNHRGHKKYSYGNLKDTSLKSIWSDIDKRKKIMDRINKEEKFSKCTHLCKPHESNKMLWNIKENLTNKNYIQNLKEKTEKLKKNLKHKEFI
jgi:radical SAM protein with 4Fe4S-binding SPASM domain